MLSRRHWMIILLATTSLASCEMPRAREAMVLLLPLTFGYKLFGYLKERRAPRYVFGLGDSPTTKMMTEPKARRLNWWRRLFRKSTQWKRRGRTPTKPANHRTSRRPHRSANPREKAAEQGSPATHDSPIGAPPTGDH